jgi:Xaa-Pro dipeptidase
MLEQHLNELYGEHIANLQEQTEAAMEKNGCERLILGAGVEPKYDKDDHGPPFRPSPDFAHWVPAITPHHLLDLKPGEKPVLYYQYPDGIDDFWLEAIETAGGVAEHIDVRRFKTVEGIWKAMKDRAPVDLKTAYIGPKDQVINGIMGADQAPDMWLELQANLDWMRRFKSPYEVECIRTAIRSAALGHKKALDIFLEGGSEFDVMLAFMDGSRTSSNEEAFSIVSSFNKKTGILHRTQRRDERDGNVMLLDAGTRVRNLNSDITTTNVQPNAPEEFASFTLLLQGLAKLQKDLCLMIEPNRSFYEIQKAAHYGIAQLLINTGFLKDCSAESAVMNGYTKAVFPHGVGHLLGVQAHDKGGEQIDPNGTPAPDASDPLFNTRKKNDSAVGEVVTIEPGIYFISKRLEQFRSSPKHSQHFNWSRIDRFLGYGMRLESDVLVTENGSEDLTAEDLPNKTNVELTA